ncbi:unnamed protein product, partial [Iphiclides podalirius]
MEIGARESAPAVVTVRLVQNGRVAAPLEVPQELHCQQNSSGLCVPLVGHAAHDVKCSENLAKELAIHLTSDDRTSVHGYLPHSPAPITARRKSQIYINLHRSFLIEKRAKRAGVSPDGSQGGKGCNGAERPAAAAASTECMKPAAAFCEAVVLQQTTIPVIQQ